MRLMILRATTGCISLKFAFVRFEVRRRKWLLPPLVRTTLPEPVRRKRFEVALWVLSLVFPPAFALRGIADFSFQTILDKINRGTKLSGPRTFNIFGTYLATQRSLLSQPEPARSSLSF